MGGRLRQRRARGPAERRPSIFRRCGQLAACLGALSLTGAAGPTATATGGLIITGSVQVTANPVPVRAHATPLMARNPLNGELVVVEVNVSGNRECSVHISTDDGRTWLPGGRVMVEPNTDCSIGAEYGTHAMPFFASDGTLHIVTTANDPKDFYLATRASTPEFPRNRSFVPRNVYISRSEDGGRTFRTSLVFEAPKENPHRGYNYAPVGAVDPKNPRHVYVGWAQGDWQSQVEPGKAVIAASGDGGETFNDPYDISEKQGSEHPWIAVGSDGVVHATYWSKGHGKPSAANPAQVFPNGPRETPTAIYYVRSEDHGKTWVSRELDPGNQRWYRPPVIVADRRSDAIYVAWYTTEERVNFALDRDGLSRTDIYLTASTDGGRTWRDRVIVNEDPQRSTNQLLPNLSIAPNGRLDIAWNDFRHSPKDPLNPGRESGMDNIYYTYSTDGGTSFAPNVRVNDRSIDRSVGVWTNGVGAQVAVGLASSESAAYFAWQEPRSSNPTANSEDVYSSTVQFEDNQGRSGRQPVRNSHVLIAGAGAGMGVGMIAMLLLGGRKEGSRATA